MPSKIKMQEGMHNDMVEQPRKIIQFQAYIDLRGWQWFAALCDDGSLWRFQDGDDWKRVHGIPQDEDDD